ncbi:MAG: efflux RND transporter periplasmic adaptor subunit [Planctomycetota bacterium]
MSAPLLLPLVACLVQGPVPKVSVAEVGRRSFQARIEVLGEVEALRETHLALEVDGLVTDVPVEEGQRVAKDEVLLRLSTEKRELSRDEAAARLELARKELEDLRLGSREEAIREARALLEQSQALLAEEVRELDRVNGLLEQGIASSKDKTAAETRTTAARAQVAQRQAALDLLEKGPRAERIAAAEQEMLARKSELAKVVYEIRQSALKAPFAGVVTEKRTELGTYVRQGDALLTLVQLDPIEVRVTMPETWVARIRAGQEASIRSEALPGRTWKAAVAAVVPRGSSLGRAFPVRLELPNPEHRLLPGMSIRATFVLAASKDVLAIPADAVVQSPRGDAVFVVVDGKAQRREVRIGRRDEGWLEVLDGVAEGEKVIVRGNERLPPGGPVQVVTFDEGRADGGK